MLVNPHQDLTPLTEIRIPLSIVSEKTLKRLGVTKLLTLHVKRFRSLHEVYYRISRRICSYVVAFTRINRLL